MTRKSILSIGMAALVFAACTVDDAEYRAVSEFGVSQDEYTVDYNSGTLDINLMTNEPITVSFSEPDLDWATVQCSPAEDGQNLDTKLHIIYTSNSGYPRMASIVLKGTTRELTLKLKQKGYLTPTLKFNDISKAVKGDAGKIQSSVTTNLLAEDVTIDIEYADEEDSSWISNTQISNGFFLFETKANPDEVSLRRATVTLSFTDGWGTVTSTSMLVTQANAKNEFGTFVPFTSLRDMPGTINKDIFIEGIIISDPTSGNNGENERLTETSMDLTGNRRTAYIQAEDGSTGYKILTSTIADNVFERYSKVKLLLRDAVVTKELNPERYIISKVTSSMLLSSEAGTAASVPTKLKCINQLTDEDVYTWVSLQNCELGIKKGPLTPINHGYCPEYVDYPVYRVCKYPSLVIDNSGNSIYTLTNTECAYSRDGQQLPYGSGTLSGIIVHETYDQYEWSGEPNEGNIGTYQIRHINRSDIAFDNDVSTANDYVCEYQYFSTSGNNIIPTRGTNGYMIHSNPNTNGSYATKVLDFSYLGPCGKAYVNIRNGNGVILPNGKQLCQSKKTNWPSYPSKTDGNMGKGIVHEDDKSAFRKIGGWWDYETDKPGAFMINLSTEGITSGNLTFIVSIGTTGPGSPRYYNLDWSETGDPEVDTDWTNIGSFTAPDTAQWPNTRWWQLPGQHKQLCVQLPSTIMNKKTVWLRIIPSCNKAGTTTGYDDGTIVTSAGVSITYLAIRSSK